MLGSFQLTLRAQDGGAGAAVQLTGAGVAGAALDCGAQIVDRNAARPHCRWIGLDANRRLGSEDIHLRNARQDAEALAHLRAGVVVELSRRDRIAGQRDVHDRLIVGIALGIGRWRGQVGRQTADGLRDRGLHVGRSGIDVLVERELEREAWRTP